MWAALLSQGLTEQECVCSCQGITAWSMQPAWCESLTRWHSLGYDRALSTRLCVGELRGQSLTCHGVQDAAPVISETLDLHLKRVIVLLNSHMICTQAPCSHPLIFPLSKGHKLQPHFVGPWLVFGTLNADPPMRPIPSTGKVRIPGPGRMIPPWQMTSALSLTSAGTAFRGLERASWALLPMRCAPVVRLLQPAPLSCNDFQGCAGSRLHRTCQGS